MSKLTVALFSLVAAVHAQQAGTLIAETHPLITWQQCTVRGGCLTLTGKIVLDADWRWLHSVTGYTNCYTGNTWDSSLCPDPTTCAQNCALEGADYSGTYGITTSGNALTLKQVSSAASGAMPGSKVYLMSTDTTYTAFKPLNREFTFDVDVSQLPCGYNGAVAFNEMAMDGGKSQFPTNGAGAKYGTGYCDAQCSRSIHFINGQANLLNWTPTTPSSGYGNYGSCCPDVDVWEANSISTSTIAHPCLANGQYRCTGSACTGGPFGLCDSAGCDFNPYRDGAQTYYGPGKTVDTTKKITVVTQFRTNDGTDTGILSEIRRYYVQNGVVIANSNTAFTNYPTFNSITDAYCEAEKAYFQEPDYFEQYAGLHAVGSAMAQGMVLSFSLSGSANDNFWLDSIYPTDAPDPTKPGVARGTCSANPGATLPVEGASPKVVYSSIKFGQLGSTSIVPA